MNIENIVIIKNDPMIISKDTIILLKNNKIITHQLIDVTPKTLSTIKRIASKYKKLNITPNPLLSSL